MVVPFVNRLQQLSGLPRIFLTLLFLSFSKLSISTCLAGSKLTTCCEQVDYHAKEACLSYASLGLNSLSRCRLWAPPAVAACQSSCGNCTVIADAIREICKFSLGQSGALLPGKVLEEYCLATQADFLAIRCPAACNTVNGSNCSDTVESQTCMSQCGNYANCDCRKQRGTMMPDICEGSTRVQLSIANSIENYTCDNTPLHCRNYLAEGATCSKYRLCPADLCLIKNVSCPPLDDCTKPGFCDPREGLCYYENADDGTQCDDGVFWTVNDTCVRGKCEGTMDKCLKLNVTCEPVSDCILDDGVCHPATGICTYSRKANGYPCDDKRANTVNDQCMDGFCSGSVVDRCSTDAVNCSKQIKNGCHAPGTCDPRTGLCSLPVPLNGKACDDDDPTTVNASCIDGVCIGQPMNWEALQFDTLGEGECTDRNGYQTASYMGDVRTESECEGVCRSDPQCIAFTVSPPSCRIYGTVRTQAPAQGDWYFMLGTVPAAVVIEQAKSSEGQRESICRKKSETGNKINADSSGQIEGSTVFTPLVLAGFFTALTLVFCSRPILRCWRSCFCGAPKPEVEHRIMVIRPVSSGPDSPAKQDLRAIAWHSWKPVDSEPASPNKMPPALELPPDSPEPLTPSQALSPYVQTPVTPLGRSPVPIAWGEHETDYPSPEKRWQRPDASKKMAGECEVAEA